RSSSGRASAPRRRGTRRPARPPPAGSRARSPSWSARRGPPRTRPSSPARSRSAGCVRVPTSTRPRRPVRRLAARRSSAYRPSTAPRAFNVADGDPPFCAAALDLLEVDAGGFRLSQGGLGGVVFHRPLLPPALAQLHRLVGRGEAEVL